AGAGRAGLDHAPQICFEPGHVKGALLHADIDVIGPGAGILAALRAGQHMPAMGADVIDRLVLRQELDRAVDAARHDRLLLLIYDRTVHREGGEHERGARICPPRIPGRDRLARPAETGPGKPRPPARFTVREDRYLMVGKEAVLAAVGDSAVCTINALSGEQHAGRGGNTYGRPGRIAKSVNVPAASLIDPQNG